MSRQPGGYIGFNRVPAALALNSAASGAWTLREAEALKRAGTWPTAPQDPFFNNVGLLLNFTGSNGSTTFTDSSPAPKTATRIGNAQISTAQSKYGGSSLLLDGSGSYIRFPDNNAWYFDGDFTIEAWIRLNAHPSSYAGDFGATILSQDDSSNGTNSYGWGLSIGGSSSQSLGILLTSSSNTRTSIVATANFALNEWYHVSAVRQGNTVYLYRDGVLLNSGGASYTAALRNSTTTLKVGALDFDETYKYWFNGYIDDVRITNGIARYQGGNTFTPPQSQLTA